MYKYFAIYALLSRIGIKCEIHDCTIVLFGYLFSEEIAPSVMGDLRQSKEDRVEAQYYSTVEQIDSKELIAKTKDFVLKMEEIIDGLSTQKITSLQRKLVSAL